MFSGQRFAILAMFFKMASLSVSDGIVICDWRAPVLFAAELRRGFNCLHAQLIDGFFIALDLHSFQTLILYIILSSSRSQKPQHKMKGAKVGAALVKKE